MSDRLTTDTSDAERFMAEAAPAVARDPKCAERYIREAFDRGFPEAPMVAEILRGLAEA